MSKKPSPLVESLKEFAENLKAGIPIEATFVRRVMTPDGPMTIRTRGVINDHKRNNDK